MHSIVSGSIGDYATVRSALEPVLVSLEEGGCQSFGNSGWISQLVESQLMQGNRRAAEHSARLQQQWALRSRTPSLVVPSFRSVAMLGDTADSDLWKEAIDQHRGWNNPVELAHAFRQRAEHRMRTEHTVSASSVSDLQEASFHFLQAGADPYAQRCEELFSQQNGAKLTATPKEAVVVRLLQMGLTNKEIAAELSVSVKTIEAQLRHLYRQNNVRNRTELVYLKR
jgi:DNA-binding CsgD family transcriptional regulator